MATLTVTTSTDYRAQTLNGIDVIDFTNLNGSIVTATFSAVQFDNAAILDNLTFNGSAGHNRVYIPGGAVNTFGWSFSNWTYGQDWITFAGTAGADTYIGTSYGESFFSREGDDFIKAGNGNDFVEGGFGADIVEGGDGDDIMTGIASGDDGFDSYYGGAGNDSIYESYANTVDGGDGDDLIVNRHVAGGTWDGGAGVDTISLDHYNSVGFVIDLSGVSFTLVGAIFSNFENAIGSDGDDTIIGGSGSNSLNGWYGDDTIYGGDGVDNLNGFHGDDMLDGGLLEDDAFGGYGNDVFKVSGADLGDNVYGGSGYDDLDLGGWTNAAVAFNVNLLTQNYQLAPNGFGESGIYDAVSIENVRGSNFNDTISGGGGNNILGGGGGVDILNGGAGHDTLNGGSQEDDCYGEIGNDKFQVTGADIGDNVYGGAGDDILDLSGWTSATVAFNVNLLTQNYQQLPNGFGPDGFYDVQGVEHVRGSEFNDIITGDGAANILVGGGGVDAMAGGAGNDRYYADSASDTVTENAGGAAGYDFVFAALSYVCPANIERLYLLEGGNFNAIGRDGEDDFLAGNSGANVINGLSGNDTIRGGLGNDTLTGGAGLDTFQFLTAPNTALNRDVITDFSTADDVIQMDNLVYTLLGVNGAPAAGLFKNLTLGAQDADDRVLYDQANGNLYYDANGLTAGGVVHFAEVTNGLALTAADFVVV